MVTSELVRVKGLPIKVKTISSEDVSVVLGQGETGGEQVLHRPVRLGMVFIPSEKVQNNNRTRVQ